MSNPLLRPRYHEFDAHGVLVKIRNVSEKERVEIVGDDKEEGEMAARRLVACAVVEADGQPVTMTVEEVAEIGFDRFKRIVKETNKHCGFGEDDAPGNSPAASATSTDSPQP